MVYWVFSVFLYYFLWYLMVFALSLPILYRIPKVQYYTKFFVFSGVIVVGSFFYVIYLGFLGRNYKNAWRFKQLFWLAGTLIGLKPVVENPEDLDFSTPCIYVANHQSCIDVASLVRVWPERCTVVSKASLLFVFPMGIIMWLSKTVCINRSRHQDAVTIMQHAAQLASRDQVSVFVFPEGTRNANGTLLPFKKGAFHMAIECKFPIQPIVIESYGSFIDHNTKRFGSALYRVKVLPRISTQDMSVNDVDTLLQETRQSMLCAFESFKRSRAT